MAELHELAKQQHKGFSGQMLWQAILASFPKLNPATLWRNPVMFVVEVGAALITLFIMPRPGHRQYGQHLAQRADRRLALDHRAVRQLRGGGGRGPRQGPGRRPAAHPQRDHRHQAGR